MDFARESGGSGGGPCAAVSIVSQTSAVRPKSAVALGLTFAAGIVYIVGYIAVYHLFVAHMTGNTVHLGHNVFAGNWDQATKAGTVILSFVVGSIAGRSIIEAGARRKMKKVATVALLTEAALILILIWAAPKGPETPGRVSWMLALLAAAMGMQTATLTRIGALTIHTTFVTGMLNKLAQEVSRWMFWLHDEFRGLTRCSELLSRSRHQVSFRTAAFMGGIWFCYLFGSLAGAWMAFHWSMRSLYVPVALLLIAAGIDQVRPLSLEEEKDQL
jgi:uncharacterized membrane protein YoaK (UPF0700 family)